MNKKKLYLRQNIKVEPLINLWYAWPYLISPATAAMVIANSQLRMMESYVSSPEFHEDAVKLPEMRGGPFMDFETRQIEYVTQLMSFTNIKCNRLLKLAGAIKELNHLLKINADGRSLEPLYQKIPVPLKGYVELVYDLNNIPSFRLIEALLYESEFSTDCLQSVLLGTIEQDYRPFAFSTPRVPKKHEVHIKLPFHSHFYSKLFEMKEQPKSIDKITDLIDTLPNKNDIDKKIFLSFFTEDAPKNYENNRALSTDSIIIKYFGHACLLIESNKCSILIDPAVSYKYNTNNNRYTYEDLPSKVDYLLITHAHLDHVLIEHLIQLRHKIKTVIVPRSNTGSLQDPSLKLFFKNIGYQHIIEIEDLETVSTQGGSITGITFLGEHADLDIQTKKAYLIRQNNATILCVADSNNIEPMLYRHIQKKVGNVDIIFVGMECNGAPLSWAYGSLLPHKPPPSIDQSRRLDGSNCKKAIDLINTFNCKQAYVYAMGQESWLNYITSVKYESDSNPIIESDKFIKECRSRGIESERLFGMKTIIYDKR